MRTKTIPFHLRQGLRGLLCSAELGMRHGPRLGAEVGAVVGSIVPIFGTAMGAAVGFVVGGPLGIAMGVIGGAINRRWGWTLGGGLPGLVLILTFLTSEAIGLGILALIAGAIAGSRLGKALESSTADHFERYQTNAEFFLAPTPLYIRLGLCAVFLWTITDVWLQLQHFFGKI
jgi:hypothetical protein